MRLNGRVAIITGGRRGIGRGIALAFAREGAGVVIADISLADSEKVIAEIKGLGGKGLAVRCDVTSRAEVEAMVKQTVDAFGKLDILVNNAGIVNFVPFLEMTEKQWDEMLAINLKGQFLCAQAAAREMVKNKWGRIINIASVSAGGFGGIAFPMIAHYTASKGGVMGLTKALAVELTPQGINVNAICPGSIETDIARGQGTSEAQRELLRRIPKGRIGQPEDVASLAVFLAAAESDYITGTAVVIDGGWLTG